VHNRLAAPDVRERSSRCERAGDHVSVVAFAPPSAAIVRRLVTSLPVTTLWLLFAVANFESWRTTHVPLGLGATALELVIAFLFVVRREPLAASRSPLAWVAAGVGTFGMLGARPHYAPVGGIEPAWIALQIGGAGLAGWAVAALGRSFGLVAANRGICTRGPYRFVRHPLYAGYLLSESGYVLENPSLRNVVLYVFVMAVQGVRVAVEERWLLRDPAYRAYAAAVRRRILPGVV
jgi:protein-S-isoprenylcysteine O-methyltransferase Ste14